MLTPVCLRNSSGFRRMSCAWYRICAGVRLRRSAAEGGLALEAVGVGLADGGGVDLGGGVASRCCSRAFASASSATFSMMSSTSVDFSSGGGGMGTPLALRTCLSSPTLRECNQPEKDIKPCERSGAVALKAKTEQEVCR